MPDQNNQPASGDGQVEVVTPQQILAETGAEATGTVKLGTWTQRAGLRLALGVGTLGAAVTLAIVGRWIWSTWCLHCPNLSSSLKPEEIDNLIKNYKALQDQAVLSATQMFDAVVVKALLPIFTSILGYIFGARNNSETSQSADH